MGGLVSKKLHDKITDPLGLIPDKYSDPLKLFGAGTPQPTVGAAPTPPSQNPTDQSAIAAAASEEMRRRAAVGRSSTVMTQGELDPANVGKKVLLGA